MSADIKESDWKIFKELHTIAMERFSRRTLPEIERLLADQDKTGHERLCDVIELVRRRHKELRELFDDYRRSAALFQLMGFRSRGLMTDDELARLSPEIRQTIEAWLSPERE